MLTPLSKPWRLTAMKSRAGPWNQVAVIQPSAGCHTVASRSQSPASRHSAQFSTSSRMANLSASTAMRAPFSWPGPELHGAIQQASGVEVGENGENAAIVAFRGWQVKLDEDRRAVLA